MANHQRHSRQGAPVADNPCCERDKPMPILKSTSGITLLSLDGDKLLNPMAQLIGRTRESALFNLQGQRLMEVANGQVFQEKGRPLLRVYESRVLSLDGQALATVEGGSREEQTLLAAAYLAFCS
jgi:hypothetical protein